MHNKPPFHLIPTLSCSEFPVTVNVETQSASVASEKKNNVESTSFFHKVNRSIKKPIIDIFNLEIQMNFAIPLSYRINSRDIFLSQLVLIMVLFPEVSKS